MEIKPIVNNTCRKLHIKFHTAHRVGSLVRQKANQCKHKDIFVVIVVFAILYKYNGSIDIVFDLSDPIVATVEIEDSDDDDDDEDGANNDGVVNNNDGDAAAALLSNELSSESSTSQSSDSDSEQSEQCKHSTKKLLHSYQSAHEQHFHLYFIAQLTTAHKANW